MATINYSVAKPFIYAGKAFQRGDVWEPQGFRNDQAMIRARMVIETTPAKKATSK